MNTTSLSWQTAVLLGEMWESTALELPWESCWYRHSAGPPYITQVGNGGAGNGAKQGAKTCSASFTRYRGSRQGLMQAWTLARRSRKFKTGFRIVFIRKPVFIYLYEFYSSSSSFASPSWFTRLARSAIDIFFPWDGLLCAAAVF